jgi:hypothetical protein
MSDFAKLFTFDDLGQVLVKLDDEDDGPEVRLYFKPEGLGVCSTAFTFNKNADGTEWDKAEKAFALIDHNQAESIVREILKTIPAGLGDPS